MYSTELAKKLKLKPGYRAAILFAPPELEVDAGLLPEGVDLVSEQALGDEPDGAADFVHLFAGSVAELNQRAPEALRTLKYDGVLWIAYPKQSSKVKTDLNRDHGWAVIAEAGLRPVTQVSVNETWSALRFRPVEKVGKEWPPVAK